MRRIILKHGTFANVIFATAWHCKNNVVRTDLLLFCNQRMWHIGNIIIVYKSIILYIVTAQNQDSIFRRRQQVIFIVWYTATTFGHLIDSCSIPPFRNLPLELVIPDHLAAGGTIGLALCVREIKLCKPVVIECFGHRLKIKTDISVVVNLSGYGFYCHRDFLLFSDIFRIWYRCIF